MKRYALSFGFTLVSAFASANLVVIDAFANSSTGGVAAVGGAFTAGEAFTVSVDPNDLWSAGGLPRWSNADGLQTNLYATGTDESGQSAGTLIGTNFGLYTQDGFSAAYGSLVGRIGTGAYFKVGTSYSGTADSTGALALYYWDSNNGDNSQFVTANIQAVPEPVSMAVLGIGALGMLRRKRKSA